jgi:DNA-directed RNA polymerase specialized sigma24 family protein
VDPIVQLEQGWRQGVAGARLARCLRVWGEREPALARFQGDAARLFRFFRTPPGPERDSVFCALLRQAKRDRLAGLVVLEALLPGIKALRGRILVDVGERDEVWALLLGNAWERILGYPVERRPSRVAANLLLDIRKATLRELVRQRPQSAVQLSGSEPAPELQSEGELTVLQALGAGVLSSAEAELILKTRVDGCPLTAVAAELGVAYQALLMRRIRAEKRLLVFLGGPVVSSRGRKRHMSIARSAAIEAADSASGGAGT